MGCGASAKKELVPEETQEGVVESTPLHEAARQGSVESLKALIEKGADVNAKTDDGCLSTSLHLATTKGSADCVKSLLDAGAKKNQKDNSGYTPLHNAVTGGFLEIMKLLIDAGVDKDAQTGGGNTPLHLAVAEVDNVKLHPTDRTISIDGVLQYKGNFDAVKLLLDAGANKDAANSSKWTPLARAAQCCVPLDIIKLLLDARANTEIKDNNQYTALHHAARFRPTNAETITALVAAKANISAKGKKDKTPLAMAKINQTEEAIEVLERLGAKA